jgi:short-subunit dehydrogenase
MTTYLVTGATGFIGGHLVQRLLARKGAHVICLVREESQGKLDDCIKSWGTTKRRVTPLVGDLTEKKLGLTKAQLDELKGTVDHVIHLAAVYDIKADAETQHTANVEGTRHVVEVVNAIRPKVFHHTSSVAAAGTYRGTFTEGMLEEAKGLDSNAYLRTKHDSEVLARELCRVPWRVYRPGMVLGDSRTGEIDKIDGPYYFFKLIQRLRGMLPQWFPLVGFEGRRLPILPVDYLADAMDHIINLDDEQWNGKVFHLLQPKGPTVGELMNTLADAAHAPKFAMRIDAAAVDLIPSGAKKVVSSLAPIVNARNAILKDLGIPEQAMQYVNWKTKFDQQHTQEALAGSGIECPRFEDYAWRIWDYWERNLDPDLFKDRSLRGAVQDKIVLVTGASDGIGKQVALDVGEAGGHVLLVSRTEEKLDAVREEIEDLGGTASVYPCDLADMDDIERMAKQVLQDHGSVDVLVNNAGRSIRRSVRLSFDRFHDYERTMQLNYFGAVKLILNLLPPMMANKRGHIINVSSIGVQTNTPRFSAYVASKSALDAFSRCIASEVIDDGVHITTVYMPLVRTKMIAPTKMYDYFPAITPEEASQMVTDSMITKTKKAATGLGNFGQIAYSVAPKVVDQLLHTAYKIFPESSAAKGEDSKSKEKASAEGMAFAHLLKGVHW